MIPTMAERKVRVCSGFDPYHKCAFLDDSGKFATCRCENALIPIKTGWTRYSSNGAPRPCSCNFSISELADFIQHIELMTLGEEPK